ncbi:MAG: heavy metal translocating P-type ATPase, partial [Brevinematia bacterium]
MNEYKFSVLGLRCISCARVVEKIIYTFGVKSAKVDFTLSTVSIISVSDLDIKSIREKLKQFGYDISPEINPEYIKRERRNLITAFILSIPVFLGMFFENLSLTHFEVIEYFLFILSSLVVFVNGFNIHRSGLTSLLYLSPNTDSLVSIGSISALMTFFMSKFLPIENFSKEALIVIDVFLLGNYIKFYLSNKATGSAKELYKLITNEANVIGNDGREIVRNIEDVKVGDILIVRPGERVPTDGIVVEGNSEVEETFVFGESEPRTVKVGDKVFGGSYNLNGNIKVKVEKEINNSLLKSMISYVEELKLYKAPIQNVTDRIIKYFVPIVFSISLVSLILWTLTGDANKGLVSFISVLVIACPCALGIAVPITLATGISRFSKFGVIIRNINAIDNLKKVNIFGIDKTGTLTIGKPSVTSLEIPLDYVDKLYTLSLLSSHPLSVSLKNYLEKNFNLNEMYKNYEVTEFRIIPGQGFEGVIDGKLFKVLRSEDDDSITSSEIFLIESN